MSRNSLKCEEHFNENNFYDVPTSRQDFAGIAVPIQYYSNNDNSEG